MRGGRRGRREEETRRTESWKTLQSLNWRPLSGVTKKSASVRESVSLLLVRRENESGETHRRCEREEGVSARPRERRRGRSEEGDARLDCVADGPAGEDRHAEAGRRLCLVVGEQLRDRELRARRSRGGQVEELVRSFSKRESMERRTVASRPSARNPSSWTYASKRCSARNKAEWATMRMAVNSR